MKRKTRKVRRVGNKRRKVKRVRNKRRKIRRIRNKRKSKCKLLELYKEEKGQWNLFCTITVAHV